MKSIRIYSVAVFAMSFLGCSALQDEDELGAKPVAADFLSNVDSGNAERAYELFTNNSKTFVTKEQVARWIQTKKVFGPVISREVILARTTNHINLAPDGTYEVCRYRTNYSLKKNAWEEVVVAKDADGWHISGYHFR
jgi:hypothetical protein